MVWYSINLVSFFFRCCWFGGMVKLKFNGWHFEKDWKTGDGYGLFFFYGMIEAMDESQIKIFNARWEMSRSYDLQIIASGLVHIIF